MKKGPAPGLTFTGIALCSRSRPRDRVSRVALILKSAEYMWYETWYELFSLLGKCEKLPFLLVAGERYTASPTTEEALFSYRRRAA
jgi:hypothetical protein